MRVPAPSALVSQATLDIVLIRFPFVFINVRVGSCRLLLLVVVGVVGIVGRIIVEKFGYVEIVVEVVIVEMKLVFGSRLSWVFPQADSEWGKTWAYAAEGESQIPLVVEKPPTNCEEMTRILGQIDKFEGHDFRLDERRKKLHILLTTLKKTSLRANTGDKGQGVRRVVFSGPFVKHEKQGLVLQRDCRRVKEITPMLVGSEKGLIGPIQDLRLLQMRGGYDSGCYNDVCKDRCWFRLSKGKRLEDLVIIQITRCHIEEKRFSLQSLDQKDIIPTVKNIKWDDEIKLDHNTYICLSSMEEDLDLIDVCNLVMRFWKRKQLMMRLVYYGKSYRVLLIYPGCKLLVAKYGFQRKMQVAGTIDQVQSTDGNQGFRQRKGLLTCLCTVAVSLN
ncbi:hypothetical protein Tco_0895954 [Tanacetum coccineum]|uniref:Uncharacterized protein n=1 Tax=Tanacetum coccineum TaxID=301880 RepID=A0ABQ5CHJ3_9ASTR